LAVIAIVCSFRFSVGSAHARSGCKVGAPALQNDFNYRQSHYACNTH
jgi:hypothetical protein